MSGPAPAGAGLTDVALADFLRRYPGELAVGPVEPTPVGWYDARRAAELGSTHREMLAAGYYADQQRHGQADYWEIDAAGDCEDKALWCHRQLSRLGWPKSAMRLWVCGALRAGRWRSHAVLVVRITLDDGTVLDTALDCLQATPVRKDDLGYRMWQVVEPKPQFSQNSAISIRSVRLPNGAAGQD